MVFRRIAKVGLMTVGLALSGCSSNSYRSEVPLPGKNIMVKNFETDKPGLSQQAQQIFEIELKNSGFTITNEKPDIILEGSFSGSRLFVPTTQIAITLKDFHGNIIFQGFKNSNIISDTWVFEGMARDLAKEMIQKL